MRGSLEDITGKRFGRLVVVERSSDYVDPKGNRFPRWKCKCDCGNEHYATSSNLKRGMVKSCGCLRNCRQFNQYYVSNGVCHLKIRSIEVLLDEADIDLINHESWYISKNGYAVGNSTKRYMHKIITGTTKSQVVDHINRNRLDNRRSNLRIANPSINAFNATRKLGTSGYRYIVRRGDNYYIYLHGKYIGHSKEILDAIQIRDKAFELYDGKKYGASL